MADVDTIALTDLEVIQQFSLAVRGASAPRAAVIAALEADLAHLRGSGRTSPSRAAAAAPAGPARATEAPAKTPARTPAKATAKAPAKKASARTPAKKSSRSA